MQGTGLSEQSILSLLHSFCLADVTLRDWMISIFIPSVYSIAPVDPVSKSWAEACESCMNKSFIHIVPQPPKKDECCLLVWLLAICVSAAITFTVMIKC